MTIPTRFKTAQWMLLAVLALAQTEVLAQQQDKAAQGQSQQSQTQPEPVQAKTESAAQGVTEPPPAKTDEEGKLISVPGSKSLGMSILGNQEAPKALVIVPWKSSELGNALGVSTVLDDSRLPIDKEVFMRMLSYYEIRSETTPSGVATTKSNAVQPAAATQRRKQ